MAREPTYPKEAAVGRTGAATPKSDPAGEDSSKGDSRRTKHLVTGAAIGIGSAAIVAALLYANRNRKN